MRIAFLITRADAIGGAAIHVRDLAIRLKADGHEPIVATGGEGVYSEMLRANGIEHHKLNWLRRSLDPVADIRGVMEVRAFLRALKPALLHAHSSKAGVVGRIAARSCGVPVIFTAHGWSFTEGVPAVQRALYKLIDRVTVPLAAQVISVSEFDRQLALQNRVGQADRIATVHNGMPDVAAELMADPAVTPPRLVMVARFEPQKDHETLLRALATLRDLHWSLSLLGDGPLLDRMSALAAELGIDDRIEFCGYQPAVASVLAESQIFVLATNWEGLPLTIVEAMRAGLPVIASNVGGVAELIDDGETGCLVPARDVDALAAALRPLIADAALRSRLGAAGRAKYRAGFTFEHMYRKTIAVYDRIAGAS